MSQTSGTISPVAAAVNYGCYAAPPANANAVFPPFPGNLAGTQYSADGGKTFAAAVAV